MEVLSAEMQSETGLPLDWYEVLLYLQEAPGGRLRMHRLADSMLLSRSAITRFVDKMESAGLVERVSCPDDRRGLDLVMTEEGRAVFRRAGRVHLRGIKEHFAQHLTAQEASVVMRAMTKVHRAARPPCDGNQTA